MSREDDFTYHNFTEDHDADAAWDDLETEDVAVYDDQAEDSEADDSEGAYPEGGQAASSNASMANGVMTNSIMRKSVRKTVSGTLCGLLLLTVGVACAFWIYTRFLASGGGNVSGEWTASLDMTEYAAAAALCWLQEIEGASPSLDEVSTSMPDLAIQVNLTLKRTSRIGGQFSSSLTPESYETCSQAAYEALAELFREITAKRLRMAGYGDGADAESVEALAAEAFGMSTVSYLMEKGPALLPALEKLQAQYDGSGIYEVKDDILARRFEGGDPDDIRAERYIRKGSLLILSKYAGADGQEGFFGQYPIIYEKR